MNKNQIKINNEIIGKFMGAELKPIVHAARNSVFYNNRWFHNYSLIPFHTDWNYLIVVAKKCINSYHDKRSDIFEALHKCDLNALYHACMVFILWYNDNSEMAKAEMAHIAKLKRNEKIRKE